jgi:uncharacterized protein with HEPN domain
MTKQSTSDPKVVQAILANLLTAVQRIERRFEGIHEPDDFVSDNDGIDRLDGIAMMLIAIGELLKQLDSIAGVDLAAQYPQVD